jgi:transcriptional regulator
MQSDKRDVCYGTLGLLILKTLEALGPLHGYRIARRIEQISGNQLALNQGTVYPALLKLEQAGWIDAAWGESDSGRRVKVYSLTRAGRRRIRIEETDWRHAQGIVARFLDIQDDTP